jgi:hypothetical protein
MRFIIAVAAALLAMAPATASAQNWFRVGGNAQSMAYVDLASLRPMGDKIVAITRSVYKEQLNGDTGIFASEIRSEYDCAGNYFRTLEYGYYNVIGEKLRTEPSQTINEHKVPVKDSLNAAMMEFVCYRKGGSAVVDTYSDSKAQFSKY